VFAPPISSVPFKRRVVDVLHQFLRLWDLCFRTTLRCLPSTEVRPRVAVLRPLARAHTHTPQHFQHAT